jgi:hypothetical protein
MLIEHTKPQSRTIGDIHLIPGFKKIEDKKWDDLIKNPKWTRPVKGLIAEGIIKVDDVRKKITIAMVEKTFNVDLLNEWLVKAKGPLKGAITKQIDVMESRPEDSEDDSLGNL